MFPQNSFTFHSWEILHVYILKFIWLNEIWIIKEFVKPQFQISNKYFRKGNNKFKLPSLYSSSGNINLLHKITNVIL